MVEIVAVLVIVGIIAAIAVSRFTDSGAKEAAAANSFKVHIRYAQLRAMGDIEPWGIRFSGSTYILEKNGATAHVNLPGEDGPEKNLVNVAITSPAIRVSFAPATGQPDPHGATIWIGETAVTIEPETGFVR